MKKLIWGFALTACLLGVAQAANPIVRIPNNAENWKLLHDLRIDYMARTPEGIDIVLDGPTRLKLQTQRARSLNVLRSSVEIMPDAESQFREVLDETRNSSPSGIYHTYEEMKEALDQAVAAMPDKIKLFEAGKTSEGRSIWGVEIKNPGTSGEKPSYLVLGSHHAREWISVEAPLYFIRDLVENYGKDAEATKLVDTSVIVIVPMLNVDGTIFSHKSQPMWRKNRNKNENGTIGVDNNRNYSYKWGVSGASSWAGSDTYMGPCAMSEAENQAVRALADKYGFVAAVSFHSYSDLILWPWSYTDKIKAKDDSILRKHGTEMGKIMGYRPIQSSELYPAAGDTDDFLYGEYGILSYTVELGSRFVPREAEYREIVKNAPKMLRYLFGTFREPLAKQVQAENYAIRQILEKVVYHKINPESLDSLSLYSKASIQGAMNDLDMDSLLQTQIMKALEHKETFSQLPQAQ
ncbi:MAG: zinc carboxypeptidase [Candidatus Cloacimonetes bacterium]|nr:zinc carboxypeptidase [Candidatus Cloacimonadota bacterium]